MSYRPLVSIVHAARVVSFMIVSLQKLDIPHVADIPLRQRRQTLTARLLADELNGFRVGVIPYESGPIEGD